MRRYIKRESCPVCKIELIRGELGSEKIGSPLVTCYKCGRTYTTNLRVEWCHYEHKLRVFFIPLFMAFGCILMGLSSKNVLAILGAGLLGFFFGIVTCCLPNMFRILASILRMRKPDYLKKLLDHRVINQTEYDLRMKNKR